ncbi:Glutarate-semialdehyde dehydrogenase DavD [Fundidesulfovibrio magnetotacticus]|uniref:Glutarate-semialdehyde dehydrogenase DavD n=1 Tax=Fundidesulfovibrio magnetotacticus TaxID=2730080 RepID=A0A6V8LWI5_9BACT|nr:NAD-dependent succinate-semialdehyde dehydrogenase [Fundidesulfovibrio magnetotacticus]GFK96094.1 Glutarate-semialdehyde dehydrogenase DavD [Fundidesulfovibrio magnetotacticus]
MRPEDLRLWKNLCYIDGQWTPALEGGVLEVSNPATGETLGTVPRCGVKETSLAISSAARAMTAWQALSPLERGEPLHALHRLIKENIDELAAILTLEQGKPLAEARGEILQGASYFPWFAEEARRLYGRVIPSPAPGKRPLTMSRPVGVTGIITPWNFPFAMIPRKAAPALAAGCTVVVKPASATPYSALALAALAEEAGIPAGVFNVVTGSASAIGGELTGDPRVRKISFTGSTEVGKKLMAQCAATVKRVSLELGGNAPFIVFDDADMDKAAEGALISKFRNSGQTCICANRLLVQESALNAFVERFQARVAVLKSGSGLIPGVTQGPLIDRAAVEHVQALVDDALVHGARLLAGGKPHALGGLFYEPTLLAGVTPSMRVYREEIFGPVAPIVTFATEKQAVEMANDTDVGLASYLFTHDLGRAWRVSEALEYGMVGVNEVILAMAEAPFGGVKESGMGREGGQEGIQDYLDTKYVLMGIGV